AGGVTRKGIRLQRWPASHCQDMPPTRIATGAAARTTTILVFAGIAASAFGAPRTTLAARPPACDRQAPFVRRPGPRSRARDTETLARDRGKPYRGYPPAD